MFNKPTHFRTLCSALLVIVMSVTVFADTVRLKDGSIIKGRIVSFASGIFTVAIGQGSRRRELTFSVSEIESIQFDGPASYGPVDTEQNQTASIARQSRPPVQVADKSRPSDDSVNKPRHSVEITDNTRPTTKQPDNRAAKAPTSSPPQSTPIRRASTSKPVELSVRVLGDNTSNGWTNSGWVVKKGQHIHISGNGEVSIGRGRKVTPSGSYSIDDSEKLLKNVPTGALLAVIGDDNNDFIYIGADREFTAERDGALFLGINEGNLDDNSGAFDVKVEITPEGGE